jgi:hypothetical protein
VPDLGSQTLDTLIGLAFVFLILSTIASGVTEGIAWVLKRRAKDLEKGLRALISDPATLNSVLNHPLIKNFAPAASPTSPSPTPESTANADQPRVPSYIAPRDFALAFVDTVAPPEDTADSRNLFERARDRLESNDPPLPGDLSRQVQVLLTDAQDDVAKFRVSVERWFDSAMDRVSGWYKRWSQWVICGVALVVTLAFNVSAVRIADRLWNDDAVRASVASAAVNATDQQAPAPTAPEPSQTPTDASEDSGQAVDNAVSELDSLKLPIGWSSANDDIGWSDLSGWLITFVAVSMGAPFWFDALSRLAHLRTTGVKPESSGDGTTS